MEFAEAQAKLVQMRHKLKLDRDWWESAQARKDLRYLRRLLCEIGANLPAWQSTGAIRCEAEFVSESCGRGARVRGTRLFKQDGSVAIAERCACDQLLDSLEDLVKFIDELPSPISFKQQLLLDEKVDALRHELVSAA